MAMVKRTLREQIEIYWIEQLGTLVKENPYTALVLLGIGIEFLGKCLDYNTRWSQIGLSETHFKYAIARLDSLKDYYPYVFVDMPPELNGLGKADKIDLAAACTDCTEALVSKNVLKGLIQRYNEELETLDKEDDSASAEQKLLELLNSMIINVHSNELKRMYADLDESKILSDVKNEITHLSSLIKPTTSVTSKSDFDLYSSLRCGMAHCGLPGNQLKVTSDTNRSIYKDDDGYVVIDALKMYEDFSKACNEMFSLAEKNGNLNDLLQSVVMVIDKPEASVVPPLNDVQDGGYAHWNDETYMDHGDDFTVPQNKSSSATFDVFLK